MRDWWAFGSGLWLGSAGGREYCITLVDDARRFPRATMERMGPRDAYFALRYEAMANPKAFAELVAARYSVDTDDPEFGERLDEFLAAVGCFGSPVSVWRSDARPAASGFTTTTIVNLVDLVDDPPATITWFEMRAVDEFGVPLAGVSFALSVDGTVEQLETDDQGYARHDGAETSFATVRPSISADLCDTLRALWGQPRNGDWLNESALEEHTFVPFRDALPAIGLRRETPHTVVLLPLVSRARLVGGMFETNKTFLVPAALGQLKTIVELYETHPRADLVLAGHTDTTGTPAVNDALSLERADAFRAFVTDDVDAWLSWWSTDKPAQTRWGNSEDHAMLEVVLLNLGLFDTSQPIGDYQTLRNLEADGVIGPITRRQLVTDYMATDGTTLPEAITPLIHGCGESFPLADDGQSLDAAVVDGQDDPTDRRVELFFFDAPLGVLPSASDRETSSREAGPYLEWRKRARKTSDFVVRHNRRLAVKAVDEVTEEPIAGAKVTLSSDGVSGKAAAETDAFGVVVFDDVEAGSYKIAVGTAVHTATSVDHSVTESDGSAGVTVPLETMVGNLIITVREKGAELMGGADVHIEGAVDKAALTNAKGVVEFESIPAGDYVITATSTGFDVFEQTVTVVGNGSTPVAGTLVSTGPQQYELLELLESVTRGGKLGTVKGATGDSKHFGRVYQRTHKHGTAYKQYVNLTKDTAGVAKRLPEQGRSIDLWAKLSWVSGKKTKTLAGKTVKWKATITPHPGAGRPATFNVNSEKPGFGGTNGNLTGTSTTDKDGWAKITFHLSQYAGDKFVISAEVDASDSEANAKPAKRSKPYVVWRKFWYQITKPHGSSVPTPTDSIAAYKAVGADMVAANTTTFRASDVPAPPSRTFYPKGMLKTGSSDTTTAAVVGPHNRTWFWGKATKEKSRPIKGHLIVCDAQWDPDGASSAHKVRMTSTTQEVTLSLGAWNAGVLKPALEGDVVVTGAWYLDPSWVIRYASGDSTLPPIPSSFVGIIDDSNVTIPLPRTALNKITITLPASAPDPTVYKVFIRLKVAYGKYFGGESKGLNMLVKYGGGNPEYYQVVSHEFGHGFRQAPDKPDKRNSTSLAVHPNQYDHHDHHGGQGSHCSKGKTHGAVTPSASAGVYSGGSCIMFHQLSPSTCTQTFCADCEPHFRLEPMTELLKAT